MKMNFRYLLPKILKGRHTSLPGTIKLCYSLSNVIWGILQKKKKKKKERDSQLLRAISLETLTMSTPLDAVKVCNNNKSNIFIVASCNILKTKLQAGTNNPMCSEKKVEEHDGLA